jgi:Ca2+-binding RTX toxin-like protein
MTIVTGTAANDVLVGTSSDDTLNGLGGADKMSGGAGNDRYFIDQAGDVVTELANKGTEDWIVSTISTALAANVEFLELVGGALNGSGNVLNNTILGNSLGNKLDGGDGDDAIAGNGGDDTLTGSKGNDYLIGGGGKNLLLGGAGDDTLAGGYGGESIMQGGAGNDYYYVESAGDQVIEAGGQGIDGIQSSISFDLSVNGANVERLFLAGANLTGNRQCARQHHRRRFG